jgi:hypothetical protein
MEEVAASLVKIGIELVNQLLDRRTVVLHHVRPPLSI